MYKKNAFFNLSIQCPFISTNELRSVDSWRWREIRERQERILAKLKHVWALEGAVNVNEFGADGAAMELVKRDAGKSKQTGKRKSRQRFSQRKKRK